MHAIIGIASVRLQCSKHLYCVIVFVTETIMTYQNKLENNFVWKYFTLGQICMTNIVEKNHNIGLFWR